MKTTTMSRRNLFLENELWARLQEEAVRLSIKEKKPVSAAEAARRILWHSLKNRKNT
jgi:hypothetical protein